MGLSLLGTVLSAGVGLAQLSMQQKAMDERKKAARLQTRRSTMQALREQQIKSAQLRAMGEHTGATTVDTTMSQFGSAAGFAGAMSHFNQRAMGYDMQAKQLGMFGNILGSFDFSGLGGPRTSSGGGAQLTPVNQLSWMK